MVDHPNPYRPPSEKIGDKRIAHRVELNGDVTAEDLVRMIRVPRIVLVLRILSVIFLAPFLVMPIVVFFFRSSPAPIELAGVLVFVMFLGGLLFTADRMVSRRPRVKRLIRKHPGLVGPLRGHLDGSGITFYNENARQYQQYSWAAFPEVVVTNDGVRLDWKSADDAFIAIPARCIDGYDAPAIDDTIHRYRSVASDPAVYQVVPDWSQKPDSAIAFHHYVQATQPPTKRELRQVRLYSLIGFLSTAGIVLSLVIEIDAVYIAVLVVIAIVSQVIIYPNYVRMDSARFVVGQWGWLGEEGGQTHVPGTTRRFLWADANRIEVFESRLAASFENDALLVIEPADLSCVPQNDAMGPDDRWQRLVACVAKHRSV